MKSKPKPRMSILSSCMSGWRNFSVDFCIVHIFFYVLECLPISVSKQKKSAQCIVVVKKYWKREKNPIEETFKVCRAELPHRQFWHASSFFSFPTRKKSHIVVYSILDLFSGFFGSLILCHFTEKICHGRLKNLHFYSVESTSGSVIVNNERGLPCFLFSRGGLQ